ncbi:MAG: hypothetical protein ACJA0S_000165 [Rickettsiales bacterium]|jgi:hypothetical protein
MENKMENKMMNKVMNKMMNKMMNKILPLKLGYFHEEDQDHFLSG